MVKNSALSLSHHFISYPRHSEEQFNLEKMQASCKMVLISVL